MRQALYALAVLTVSVTFAYGQNKPHPWCNTLQVVVPSEDRQAKELAEAFMAELGVSFDLKGYVVMEAEAEQIIDGVSQNTIDFTILPEALAEPGARGEILWSCCKENLANATLEHGWIAKVDPAEILSQAEMQGRNFNYAIIASPRVFEMGYIHRMNIFEAAEVSTTKWAQPID